MTTEQLTVDDIEERREELKLEEIRLGRERAKARCNELIDTICRILNNRSSGPLEDK